MFNVEETIRSGCRLSLYGRIVREANPKSKYSYELQRLDVGVGACHFGSFIKLSGTGVTVPNY